MALPGRFLEQQICNSLLHCCSMRQSTVFLRMGQRRTACQTARRYPSANPPTACTPARRSALSLLHSVHAGLSTHEASMLSELASPGEHIFDCDMLEVANGKRSHEVETANFCLDAHRATSTAISCGTTTAA